MDGRPAGRTSTWSALPSICLGSQTRPPVPRQTVQAIFSGHVFEHIPIVGVLALMPVLVPDGFFRVAVPDAGALLRSDAGTDDEEWALSRSTRMQAVMSLFDERGHRTMYDEEQLTALCELADLDPVTVCEFRASRLDDAFWTAPTVATGRFTSRAQLHVGAGWYECCLPASL